MFLSLFTERQRRIHAQAPARLHLPMHRRKCPEGERKRKEAKRKEESIEGSRRVTRERQRDEAVQTRGGKKEKSSPKKKGKEEDEEKAERGREEERETDGGREGGKERYLKSPRFTRIERIDVGRRQETRQNNALNHRLRFSRENEKERRKEKKRSPTPRKGKVEKP